MPELLIKNMVCPRCIMAVERVLKEQEIGFHEISLGKVVLVSPLVPEELQSLETKLTELGFGLIKTREEIILEQIRNKLHQVLSWEEIPASFGLSSYLSTELGEDYSKLSHLFSTQQHTTIEKYFIRLKLEKVKELLFNQELQLSEIAWKLGYGSVQHLSGQFKKQLGVTPSAYKKMSDKDRIGLDAVK